MLLLFLTGCARSRDDKTLVVRDQQLLQQFDALQQKWKQKRLTSAEYAAGLQSLQKQEAVLFRQVRQHHFQDMTAGNRFYRWRLKFPSPIKEAQTRLIIQQ